ncbi:MAG TPA: hypothetical protein VHX37_08400 [Acidobacteriaceae bacterium]|nr:hypothetical protein [Acidobacteriaceae bacterium]
MVLEAQDCVLRVEQQMIEVLQENGRLRERMENCERGRMAQGVSVQTLLPADGVAAGFLQGAD